LESLETKSSKTLILVIDNADEVTDEYVRTIQNFLPRHAGIILFTTRDRSNVGKLIQDSELCITLDAEMIPKIAEKTFYARVGSQLDGLGYDKNSLSELLTKLGNFTSGYHSSSQLYAN